MYVKVNPLYYVKTATMQRCHSSHLLYVNVSKVCCINVSSVYVKLRSVCVKVNFIYTM